MVVEIVQTAMPVSTSLLNQKELRHAAHTFDGCIFPATGTFWRLSRLIAVRVKPTVTAMTDALRASAFLVALLSLPGAIADVVVRFFQILQWSLFPMMSPERVPHAVAIYVTQWWLTLLGLALLGAATYSWIYERSHPRADGF